MRAFRVQVGANFSPFSVPSLVNAITHNIEVAEGGRKLQGEQVYNYALFAYGLPSGHLFQDRIENVTCSLGCQASTDDIQKAVQTFTNPDVAVVEGGERRRARPKVKTKAPPPVVGDRDRAERQRRSPGAAADTSYLLGQRGLPDADPAEQPEGRRADAASSTRRSTTTRRSGARRRRRPRCRT